MQKRLFAYAVLFSVGLVLAASAAAQNETRTPDVVPMNQPVNTIQPAPAVIFRPQGSIITPQSSIARPEDAGLRAHTNVLIFVPAGRSLATSNPDYTFAETPASLGCVYGIGPIYTGCNPATGGTNHPSGGWGVIAIVDAYNNPHAAADLATFSSQYGLPAANFTKVSANTSFGALNGFSASCSGTPPNDTGWGLEEDLDIEWAHAMAPDAKILLVEACSNSYNDLFFAEQVAGIKIPHLGSGGQISNSWGGSEFSGEVGAVDDVFYRYSWEQITYFASAGDSGWGAAYPSSSPWVVSAGGTTVNRDVSGNFVSESCWSGSGGGVSQYELWQTPPVITNGMGPWSSYQFPLAALGARMTPDLSFDADPNSGAYVYDSFGYGGWVVVGGTSLSSPALAGIVNFSNNRLGQAPTGGGNYSAEENTFIYSQLSTHRYTANFYDVTTGSNGSGHNAVAGYDQCTGVGTPRGKLGK